MITSNHIDYSKAISQANSDLEDPKVQDLLYRASRAAYEKRTQDNVRNTNNVAAIAYFTEDNNEIQVVVKTSQGAGSTTGHAEQMAVKNVLENLREKSSNNNNNNNNNNQANDKDLLQNVTLVLFTEREPCNRGKQSCKKYLDKNLDSSKHLVFYSVENDPNCAPNKNSKNMVNNLDKELQDATKNYRDTYKTLDSIPKKATTKKRRKIRKRKRSQTTLGKNSKRKLNYQPEDPLLTAAKSPPNQQSNNDNGNPNVANQSRNNLSMSPSK